MRFFLIPKYEFELQPISTWRKITCYCSVRDFTLILVNVVLIQVKPVQNRQLITRQRSKQTMFVADLFMIDHVYNRPVLNRLVHARRMFTTHHVHNRPVTNRSVMNVFCFEWSVTSSGVVKGLRGSRAAPSGGRQIFD